ncbi:MAG: amino acid permease [Chthoniobacterales bacterium]
MNTQPNESSSGKSDAQLKQALGPLDATMIVVGSMIGSGIFITSAESARLIGSPGWLLIAWILAGILTITGALCCAELAAMIPRAGGPYVFLREAYGPSIGFLYGWAIFLVIQTGTIAAVAVAFAKFLGVLLPAISPDHYLMSPVPIGAGYALSFSTEQCIAVTLILLLSWTNTRGLELGKLVQNTFTFAKTAALAALIVIGLAFGWKGTSAAFSSSWWNPWANGWQPQIAQPGLALTGSLAMAVLLGKAMVGPLFAQSAWNNVTFTGSEVRDPGRNLPRALLAGCGIVVTLYVLANVAYIATLPFPEIQHAPQNRVAVAAMNAVLGPPGTILMAIAIMISTFGCNNGLILAGARVYYAMALDRLFFRRVAKINRHNAPAFALFVQGLWAAFLTLPRTVTTDPVTGTVKYGNVYTQLLEYIVSADLIFYVLIVAAVIILRRKQPATTRPYRAWGYPIIPIVYMLLAGLLIVDIAAMAPSTSGIGILLVLTGVPVYFAWRTRAAAA